MTTITRAVRGTRDFLSGQTFFFILFFVVASLLVGVLLLNDFVPDYVVILGLIAMPLVFAVGFAIIRNLYIGIVIFMILEYLQPGYRIPFLAAIRPALLVSAALGAAWVVNVMRHKVPLVLNWQVWSYVILLSLGLVSALAAISVGMVGLTLITLSKTLIVFTIMYSAVRTFDQLKRVAWLYILLHVILSVGLFALFVTGGERRFGRSGRQLPRRRERLGDGDPDHDPVHVLHAPDEAPARARLVLLLGIFLSSLSVLFSFSRGAFVGFSTMVLYMWAKESKKLRAGLIIAGVVGLFFAIMPPSYWQRIESVKGYATEGSSQGRLDAWKGGIQMMIDSPIFGCGIGNFSRTYGEHYNTINARWTAAHSLYIEFIGQLGVPGLLFILGYIVLTLRTFRIARRIVRPIEGEEARTFEKIMLGAECGFVTYLVTTVFLSSMMYPHLWHFGAMSGLGLIVARSMAAQAAPPVPPVPRVVGPAPRRMDAVRIGSGT